MTGDRKETTRLLTEILIRDRLTDRKYYALEVTLDYGTKDARRVDVMQFSPKGVSYASDIEKGTFTCYEIKSCREDIYSGKGINFFGEKNYFVVSMETYGSILGDYRSGHLERYLDERHPQSSHHYGFLVAVPSHIDVRDNKAVMKEFQKPTKFGGSAQDWKLACLIPCYEGPRKRSSVELLFCMLRARHNDTNAQR